MPYCAYIPERDALRKNESTTTDYNCKERWFSREELFIEHGLSANDVIDVWALWCTLLRIPYEGDFGTRWIDVFRQRELTQLTIVRGRIQWSWE